MIQSPNISTPIMPVGGSIKTPIMPLQNATIKTPMWPVQNVIQHTQLWGDFQTTPMQTNRQAMNNGEAATSERMYAARAPIAVSNFGDETKIGNGELSRTSRETLETSVEAISSIMEKDDQYESSKIGEYSGMGPTGFQSYNDRSFETQQQAASRAYAYFQNYQ